MTVLAITTADAESLEAAFLGGLDEAQYAYERIVETEAWTALGFESFAGWWEDRVQPAMRALSMRPTREIVAAVVEQVRAEEAALPPAQRRTQRELAEMVGVERSSLANRDGSRSVPREESRRADLEPDPTAEPAAMPAGQDAADAIMAALDQRTADRLKEQAEIAQSHKALRDDLKAIPAERIAEIKESVKPAVEFGQLVDACRQFLEMLARVDLDYAARGIDTDKLPTVTRAIDLLRRVEQILGVPA